MDTAERGAAAELNAVAGVILIVAAILVSGDLKPTKIMLLPLWAITVLLTLTAVYWKNQVTQYWIRLALGVVGAGTYAWGIYATGAFEACMTHYPGYRPGTDDLTVFVVGTILLLVYAAFGITALDYIKIRQKEAHE